MSALKKSNRASRVRAAASAGIAAVTIAGVAGFASAAIFQPATGTASWATATNWNPATVPNAVGDNATFNGAATGSNPAQTGNRTATLDGTKTVGSILFNSDLSTFTNTISTGTGGPLVFDETGSGPATITTQGTGTGNNTISVAMTLNDDLTANVNQQNTASATGSLNLTGTMGGNGGFTKNGDGMVTFGTGLKTYTGPTVINGGRFRMSSTARPQSSSSVTVANGGQINMITDTGTYTLAGTLNLNGAGPTSGQFSVFPGALRQDTGIAVTVPGAVNLQSSSLIHVQATAGTGSSASPTGSLTLSGIVSGGASALLTFTAPGSNIDQGSLILTNANTYAGGTLVAGGILTASGANATFGTGDIDVDNASSPSSIARLSIASGVLNAIADTATLELAGGNAGFAILGAGVNDTIGGLVLGGVTQTTPGTYGSTSSGATFQNDTYFSGTGVVTLVPEPASLSLLAIGAAGLVLGRRRRA